MSETYELDGSAFTDLTGFAAHFSARVLSGYQWNGNLDALNDILRGGFGTPDGGFLLRIRHVEAARKALGYAETVKWLEEHVAHCHPSSVTQLARRLDEARLGHGDTLFDVVLGIFRDHGPGGSQATDNGRLELEVEARGRTTGIWTPPVK